MIHLPQFFFKMSVSNEIRLVNKQGVLSYCVVDSSNVAMSGCTVNSINNLPDFVYEFSLKGIDLSKKYVDLNYKNGTLFINDEPIKNMVGTVRNVKKMSLEFPNHINIRKDVFKAELKQWSKNSAIIIGTDLQDRGTLLINNREVTESIRAKKEGISVYSNEYLLEYLDTIPDDVRLYIDYDLNYPMQIKFMPEKAEYKGYDNFFILAPRAVGYRESPWDFVIPAKKKKEYVPLKLKPGEQQIKFKIPFDPKGRNLTFIETSYDAQRALTNNVHYIVFSFVRRVKNRRRIIYGAYDRKRKIIAYNDSNYDDSGKNVSTSSLFDLLNNLPFDTYYDCKKYNINDIENIINSIATYGISNEEFINNCVSRLIYGVYFKEEKPQQKEEVKEMTNNPFKFVLSDEFYMRYDYSDMMLSILSFSERGAVCSLIQSERIINDYDWERDYDYLTTHKPIDGVFKKPSVSKDKISLELPIGKSEFIFEGKVLKKQKTDVSKWEQKFNQISKIVNSPDPDSAVVISDFEKLYEIIRGLKGKLGKDNLIIFTIKKSGKGRDQLSTFSINNTLLMEHGIESPFLVFDSEKTDEINVYLDYGIVCRVLKLIIDNNHYGTKGNIRIEFSEKNPVVFDWDASIVVAQKRLTPDEIKSIKTQNKDKMTAKANNFGDLNSVKKEIERIYSQIDALEKEKTKWERMGDKKRVQYYTELIKDNEHKIKTFQKVISDVEKMTAKKTTKKTPAKKASTTKKTSGTPRTKGLHQTGTQTLAGKSMDAKIKAELPGKRTSATGKTYYEYRVNRTDMPTEREDFEKLFGKVKRAPAKKKTAAKNPTKKTASGTPAKKKASSGTASAPKSAKKKQVKSRKTSKTQKTLF